MEDSKWHEKIYIKNFLFVTFFHDFSISALSTIKISLFQPDFKNIPNKSCMWLKQSENLHSPSPYEWKILEWDDKPQTNNKQTKKHSPFVIFFYSLFCLDYPVQDRISHFSDFPHSDWNQPPSPIDDRRRGAGFNQTKIFPNLDPRQGSSYYNQR